MFKFDSNSCQVTIGNQFFGFGLPEWQPYSNKQKNRDRIRVSQLQNMQSKINNGWMFVALLIFKYESYRKRSTWRLCLLALYKNDYAYVNAQTMLTCTDTFTHIQLRSWLHIQGFIRLSCESCVLNGLIAGEQVVSVYLWQMISVIID